MFDNPESDSDPQSLNDSESEDVLHGVNPNKVFTSGPLADPSSESDSGISEDPVISESSMNTLTTTTVPPVAPATVYQVVYDIGGVENETRPQNVEVISIELGENGH